MELLSLYLSAIDEVRFKVVARSQSGQDEADSRLPFYESEQRWRTTLIKALELDEFSPGAFQPEELNWITSQGWLSGDRKSSHPNRLARIGLAMYEALFPEGGVRHILQRMIDRAETEGVQLHIQLEFAPDVTKHNRFRDYPWELASPDGKTFLAHHQVRFSRYIAYPSAVPQFSLTEKLNILLVSSRASDVDKGLLPLSKKEQKAVSKGLEAAQEDGHINAEVLPTASLNGLRTYLTNHIGKQAPHIFHFDGHGYFGKRCDVCRTIHKDLRTRNCEECGSELPEPQGYLVFETEDDETEADYVSATELGTLLQSTSFRNAETQRGGVAVAVLSACKSGMALGSESVFNGVAQGLINHRIPSVVAMQYTVRVDSATRFAEQFYRSLGRKNSLGIAVSQGQEAMGVTGNQWYRPVLYLRWQDNEGGQLFVIEESKNASSAESIVVERSALVEEQPVDRQTSGFLSGSRRDFYIKELKRKRLSLAAVQNDLETCLSQEQELKLRNRVEQLLKEIEDLEKELSI